MMREDDKAVYRSREAEGRHTQKIKTLAPRALSRQELTFLRSHSGKTRMRSPITALSLGFCYRPKCVPPKFVCWSPNTQCVSRWLYMEARPSKKWSSSKEAIRVGSHWFSWCAYKKRSLGPRETPGTNADGGKTMWGYSKDTVQAKERGLSRTPACQTYRSWTSSLQKKWEKNYVDEVTQSVIFCYGSPSKPIPSTFYVITLMNESYMKMIF